MSVTTFTKTKILKNIDSLMEITEKKYTTDELIYRLISRHQEYNTPLIFECEIKNFYAREYLVEPDTMKEIAQKYNATSFFSEFGSAIKTLYYDMIFEDNLKELLKNKK